MSALWQADIAGLRRLVRRAEIDAAEQTAQAQAQTERNAQRSQHLQGATSKTARNNRQNILAWVRKSARGAGNAASANKAAEALGLEPDTARKHLAALAEEGSIQTRRTRGGQSRFYAGAAA